MNKYLKESILWIFIVLPYVYLETIWKNLPKIVPTHFDSRGNVNGWSDKNSLVFLIGAMGIGFYIFLILIKSNPKMQQLGIKYYSFRLAVSILMSIISLFILFSANGSKI
jgi:uncharacterized membrane protein